jgi:predicted metal-dependent peptidase
MNAKDMLSKAKANLILEQPFHASLICAMPFVETPGLNPPTMAVDGKTIFYDRDFVEGMSVEELKFVLCHEVMHCVFAHMYRRGGRQPRRWNMAADYVINDLLTSEKIGKMPEGGLLNAQLVVAGGGTADGVYDLIPEQDEGSGDDDGSGAGPMDNCMDAPGTGPEREAAQADMKVRVASAAQAAKMCGKLSAGIRRLVDDTLKPTVDWREVLRRFVTAKAKVEYSYARPKRRFVADDLYLPSLGGNAMGVLAVPVDCSGSIGAAELAEFAAEMAGIKQDCNPSEMHAIYFDSQVSHHEKFTRDDDLHVEAHGGGGTAFSPIFTFIDTNGIEPCCAVVLTDLYCSDFGPQPDYPVLWITTGATDAPWGEVVEMRPRR